MERQICSSNFAHAFECESCPSTNGPNGCPAWWEVVATDLQTGQSVLKAGCGFVQMPVFLVESIKAANRPAAEMSQMRDELVGAARAIMKGAVEVPQLTDKRRG